MVEKYYAYYKGQRINAYDALTLKRDRIISTAPVSAAELFDSPDILDRYPVKPNKGRTKKDSKERGFPFFSYYPSNKPAGNNLGGTGSKVTLAHAVFQDIFSTVPHFKAKHAGNEIDVSVDRVTVDYRIKVSGNDYYIIEIFYQLNQTEPYSYYYKWNGSLAMEIVVTNPVTKEKVESLSEKGIQVCELPVPKVIENELREATKQMFTDSIEEFSSHKDQETINLQKEHDLYLKYYKKYFGLFESKKYIVYCNLLGKVKTKPEWEVKYHNMLKYEQQEAEMKRRIEQKQQELLQLLQAEKTIGQRVDSLKSKERQLESRIETEENKDLQIQQLEENKRRLEKENSLLSDREKKLLDELSDKDSIKKQLARSNEKNEILETKNAELSMNVIQRLLKRRDKKR